MISLCNNWEFVESFSEEFLAGNVKGLEVRIPHNVKELPLHYADSNAYQMISGYRKKLMIEKEMIGKRVFLQFDGVGHVATVYLNGKELMTHPTGYTAFRVDISKEIVEGENDLVVKVDSRESCNTPPFGLVIDYLTYGGIYREVWLDVKEETFVEDVFVSTPQLHRAHIEVKQNGPRKQMNIQILDKDVVVFEKQNCEDKSDFTVAGIKNWSTERPYVYTCRVELVENEEVVDVKEVTFGFRTAEWKADGFYLNGRKVFLRGLNRHQCYPYFGYAATESLQREDARILKEELHLNAVRTSHYPQSHYFIDECDRLGLIVFTEIPGWQHIGDADWKAQAVENVKEMVLQYRNHPSIVLWGVRINESVDDDEFYKQTNAVAHLLDPTRFTSGVRYIEKSSLLEDVYAFNDFSHNGKTPGCKPKNKVSTDMNKALIISEHNGHMYPTKSYDWSTHRQNQALRHATVLNAAMADGNHGGCFGWCMFDYATHKDFGSGDRICYHGVMDSFRNPKLAASMYASQSEDSPVLAVGSSMDIGDYAGGQIEKMYVFTNADEVKLYKNGNYVTSFKDSEFKALPHGPILVDDMIGELLESQEGYDHNKAEILRECLVAAGKYGFNNMPMDKNAKLAYSMLRYGLKFEDGVRLYGKYVGNWGGEATVWRFDGIKDGEVVSSVTKCPSVKLHLDVQVSNTHLVEKQTYEMSAVRVRILDEYNNVASYAQLPVTFKLSGEAELIGPEVVTAEGAMCGTYLKSVGKTGKAVLTVSCQQCESVTVEFDCEG